MQVLLYLTSAVAFIYGGQAITHPPNDGCAASVFCGSMEDNGFCANSEHCSRVKLWCHDAASGKCVPFSYYGHGGNYNRFYTKEQCEKTCIGYSNSYKYKQLCDKCPNPVHMDIEFDFNTLTEKGFFCNGDDCKCETGQKCCPVVYTVTYTDPGVSTTETLNGFTCLPTVVGKCEEPYDDCGKRKRRHRHSHKKY